MKGYGRTPGSADRRVLIFPAGTEIGLEIQASLKDVRGMKLFAAGADVSNPARFVFSEYHVLPPVSEPGWDLALAELCQRLQIGYLMPAHDDVIAALAGTKIKPPCVVIGSPDEVSLLTRRKSATYSRLASVLRVPEQYLPDQVTTFPVFVKPDCGNGSINARRAESREDLDAALRETHDPIICEFLPGEEYTVDCFSDRERGLLFCGARVRRRMRNGISVNTETLDLQEAETMARSISSALELHGAWFFQFKRASDGHPVLLEVAPRIAGAMAAHRVQGINFALLSILESERLPIHILRNPGPVEMDRSLRSRYRHKIEFDTLYVDLDDTLLQEGKVNIAVVQLIFWCINHEKRTILLTRHAGSLNHTLSLHRISGLFDEIIHLQAGELKSSRIRSGQSVFVDDSFSERLDVATHCGILTFDCSMIEMLYDRHEPGQ